ncbi:Peptidase M15 [Devosia equisanguinis]|uniref:Murein endopeptidase K n=2 Tax=Devosia equisanguinis TaxID=2490941 RepID=A0A447IAF3_9HYPH|nr:DUF882 domain-containing protein [Devosia equisanguinis]VDS04404.1 Peptidase M15 [Devosia equisanguinis]
MIAALSMIFVFAAAPVQAASERALYLYYTHTKETARIVFKRNGQYVQSGLNELNYFLRDWRRNEPTKMDPRLFDLVWEVYQDVGASQPINVVSAYRSPQTNAMLAKNSSGVADNSQHMRGTAMDFFIPGVPLAKLRAAAMRKQVGGVGYYPTSGSPFVHLDVGSVRAWPRMTRAQLKEIFPDGRTMHLPTDGKPLSQEGYNVALAEWKRCHAFPCGGGSSGTQVASNNSAGGGGKTLMDMFFGGNDNQQAAQPAPQAQVQTASLAAPVATPSASPIAPVPAMRPASLGMPMQQTAAAAPVAPMPATAPMEVASAAPTAIPFSTVGSAPLDPSELTTAHIAPMPVMKSERLQVATASALPAGDAVTALAALTAPPVPQPRLIMSETPDTLTAYLPTNGPEPEAQRALDMIISGSTPARNAPTPLPGLRLPILPGGVAAATGIQTASLGGAAADPMANLFASTFDAAGKTTAEPLAAALAQHVSRPEGTDAMRDRDFVAPDLEHVVDIFMAPAALTSDHFAVIFDHDEADFDPTPEMGRYVVVMSAGDDTTSLGHKSFSPAKPLAVASN